MSLFLRVPIFFLSVLGLLTLANMVVYSAVVTLTTPSQWWQLVGLGVGLGLLSLSFIVATVLGTRFYNRGTRWYYTVTAIWIGFLVYLFFASILFGLLALVIPLAWLPVIGSLLLGGALILSLVGWLLARKIVVREVLITLPNLPTSWEGRKAVWLSDVHLGQLRGPKFLQQIVDQVNELERDLVFIGGDLFDGTLAPDIKVLCAPLEKLRAPLGTFFVTGNHEEYGHSKTFTDIISAYGVRVLADEKIELDGVQLVGVDYTSASQYADFERILGGLALDQSKPAILLKHEPRDLATAARAGISLQLSGHTHKAQLWPLSYLADWVYKGFSYGLKQFETMQVFVSSGTGTWGPPLRIGSRCELVVFTFKKSDKS